MAQGSPKRRQVTRLSTMRTWIAVGVIAAVTATTAIIANGYDARETPRADPNVWVTRDAGQYARVNTDTGEIDLVRKVSEPSSIAQAGGSSVLFSHGNGRAWPLDAANPQDLSDAQQDAKDKDKDNKGKDAKNKKQDKGASAQTVSQQDPENSAAATAVSMPDGTRDVLVAGSYLAIRTEGGDVYAGRLRDDPAAADLAAPNLAGHPEEVASRITSLVRVTAEDGPGGGSTTDPNTPDEGGDASANPDGEAKPEEAYDAIGLSASGTIALVSLAGEHVSRYDVETSTLAKETAQLPEQLQGATAQNTQIAFVGPSWVLLDSENGQVWREGDDPVGISATDNALLQRSSNGRDVPGLAGTTALIADADGLIAVTASGDVSRVHEASGTAARPIEVDGTRYAAWVGQNSGSLWRAGAEPVQLTVDSVAGDAGELNPVFRSNGSRAVLNESRTGMLWTVPDGAAIPLSQWTISDPPKENTGTVVVDDVSEQVPPTAVDDAFGVRAGEPVELPVMLNDFDANKRDVLTIVPESLTDSELPETFGTLRVVDGGQALTAQIEAGATGSATFTYRVSDGAQESAPATVTLTVKGDEVSTAPEWCPVDGCQRSWGVPAIIPGGTLVYPVLDGWVDPEGDPMMLAGVEPVRKGDPVRAIVTADGRLAVRHTDANAGAAEILLNVTVEDSRGESTGRELQISVRDDAAAVFEPVAAQVPAGETRTEAPLERMAGGSGFFALVDAVVQTGGEAVQVTAHPATGLVDLTGVAAGEASVTLTMRDTETNTELTGLMRVTVTPGRTPLTLPPLRAFVRPLSDSNVEVLAAVQGSRSRALSVVDATVLDGELRADVLGHSSVRVAGATEDGAPGRIGAVDVTISEFDATATGRLTVFQVPETSTQGPIARADTAVVRAGAVVDIKVLDNDVAAPGERLLLHPEITGSGTEGELAFASGSVLRYLAPKKAGTYRLGYTTYGVSSPESSDVGTVIVTVLPDGANRDPQPERLTVRLAAGNQADVAVPLSNIDPDGDRARLTGVDAPQDAQLSVSLAATSAEISVTASESAKPGTTQVQYRVRDTAGGVGTGVLNVIVTPPVVSSGAPVAITDYVRLVPGTKEPAAVRPLDNDIDPARGALSITRVVPNVAGGSANPAYKKWAELIDTSALKDGVVRVTAGKDLGTVSYTYTISSSASKSTVDGLIVVQTSDRVGAQAPQITDTVLNVRERAQLTGAGVDVVTDKVRWSFGDVSTLKLSLWSSETGDYETEGTRISGAYDPEGDLVVFKLTGTDITGTDVESYGFLTIPSLDELRVTLQAGLPVLSVDENESVRVRVTDLVDLGPDDRAELRQGSFGVGRENATCSANSADTLVYSAGEGEPWTDVCVIDVRLVGQKTWTSLPVPVAIVPRTPAATLAPLTRTVAPGETERISLTDMVEWQGGRSGDTDDLSFEVTGGSDAFSVTAEGQTAMVEARADATPGAQDTLTVAVSGAGSASAPLTLRIGEATKDTPRGASVALSCSVGAECGVTVIGAAGEYDPFAGRAGSGLTLASVDSGSCTVASFAKASDTSVSVTWPEGTVTGATCTVGFTVTDAQGRVGSGTIEFDAQGRPAAPASIEQIGYDDTSAYFTVVLGGQQAHPDVTGVVLSGGGETSCVASGPATYQCYADGLSNGEKHSFTARAVNPVGESDPSNAVVAWAYAAPAAPSVTLTPVKNPTNTDPSSGSVQLTVAGASDVARFDVVSNRGHADTIADTSGEITFAAEAGPISFTVTPVTRFEVPNIGAGSAAGGSTTVEGMVYGAPRLYSATLVGVGTTGYVNFSGETEGATARYAMSAPYGQPGECYSGGSSNSEFSGLKKFRMYTARVCVMSDYGRAESVTPAALMGSDTAVPTPNLAQYMVNPAAAELGTGFSFDLLTDQSSTFIATSDDMTGQWNVDGVVVAADALGSALTASSGSVLARQCANTAFENSCSEWISATPLTAPAPVTVDLSGVCYDAANPPANESEEIKALVAMSAAAAGSFKVVAGAPDEVGLTIPLEVTMTGSFESLQVVTLTGCYTPLPQPPPDPDPETPPGTP